MTNPNPPRFLALDVFRGMTICFMIIVNTPGSWKFIYPPLEHAEWNGFTPTDLVFPSFLFAVGNALSFVMNKWVNMPEKKVLWKIIKRTLLIFLIGYLLYWFPFFTSDDAGHLMLAPMKDTRVFGVLQRIALCYGIAALMVYYLQPRTILWITLGILVLYYPVLYFGGDQPDPLSLRQNAVLKLDRWLIGESHMYKGEGLAFDPEGFLSTFPAIVNVIGGYWVGRYIQVKGKTYEALTGLLLAGSVLAAIAFMWDYSFPVNKKLWSSSFAVYTVALDCIIIAVIIYVIDFQKKTRWTYFFEVFGRNPLVIYILSGLIAQFLGMLPGGEDGSAYGWIYNNIFKPINPYLGSFLFALMIMFICWLVGWWMDKKRVYIRV